MIFTKIDQVVLEKIEDSEDDKRKVERKPFVKRNPVDGAYYAYLASGPVLKCHNKATAEFYIRDEKSKG